MRLLKDTVLQPIAQLVSEMELQQKDESSFFSAVASMCAHIFTKKIQLFGSLLSLFRVVSKMYKTHAIHKLSLQIKPLSCSRMGSTLMKPIHSKSNTFLPTRSKHFKDSLYINHTS